jgi:hypothetical protein
MLLATRLGALLILKESLASFRLSSGCRLELTFAVKPTRSNVAEDSARACSNAPLCVAVADSSPGALSATASERVEGSLNVRPTPLGHARDARRYGRGMRSAVRASGSSSHDLCHAACQLRLMRDWTRALTKTLGEYAHGVYQLCEARSLV